MRSGRLCGAGAGLLFLTVKVKSPASRSPRTGRRFHIIQLEVADQAFKLIIGAHMSSLSSAGTPFLSFFCGRKSTICRYIIYNTSNWHNNQILREIYFSGRCTREGSAAAAPTKQDDDNEKNPDPACVGAAESQTVAAAASAPAVAVVANRYASTSTVTVVHHD